MGGGAALRHGWGWVADTRCFASQASRFVAPLPTRTNLFCGSSLPPCPTDVALLVLRAVHGLDVMTGTSKAGAAGTAGAAAAGTTAGAAPAAAAAPGGGLLEQAVGGGGAERGGEGERAFEPTSPRQHLISLP